MSFSSLCGLAEINLHGTWGCTGVFPGEFQVTSGGVDIISAQGGPRPQGLRYRVRFMADNTLQLDGQPLNFAQIEAVARDGLTVAIGKQALENIQQARSVVETHSEGAEAVYGINTGFGSLSRHRIEGEDLRAVQRNLIRSHAAGVGEMLPEEIVRAMLLILASSLGRGRSGARSEVVQLIVDMLNHGITPQVPSI